MPMNDAFLTLPLARSRTIQFAALAGLLACAGFAASARAGFAVEPAPVAHAAQDALPAGEALVRAATERMGGEEWKSLKSFHTRATTKSAMGEASIEYRWIAPDARLLVQTMPGGRGTMEMGVARGVAWIGEAGKARAVDTRMAEELAGGGDLQTLVHSLEGRFEDFRTESRETLDARIVWRVSMRPRGTPTPDARWTLYIDAATGLVHGFDIPAPPKDSQSDAPTATSQSIRLSSWRPVDVGDSAPRSRLIAFRVAKVSAGGMETELEYATVAINTLGADAIAVPASIEEETSAPRPTPPAANPPATAPVPAPAAETASPSNAPPADAPGASIGTR
jgi:hypothetical protein